MDMANTNTKQESIMQLILEFSRALYIFHLTSLNELFGPPVQIRGTRSIFDDSKDFDLSTHVWARFPQCVSDV